MGIVAFDPGKVTGVVEIVNGKLNNVYSIEKEELMGKILHGRWYSFDVIIAEEFRLYPWSLKKGQKFAYLHSPKILGMLELYAYDAQIKFVLQWAGNAKQYATDEKLKEVGWWSTLKNPHERDAARHALYYMNLSYKRKADKFKKKRKLNEKV